MNLKEKMEKWEYLKHYKDVYKEIKRAKKVEDKDFILSTILMRKAMDILVDEVLKEKGKEIQPEILAYKILVIKNGDPGLLSNVVDDFKSITDKICFGIIGKKANYENVEKCFDAIAQNIIRGQEISTLSDKIYNVPNDFGKLGKKDINKAITKVRNFREEEPEFGVYYAQKLAVNMLYKICEQNGISNIIGDFKVKSEINFEKMRKNIKDRQQLVLIDAGEAILKQSKELQRKSVDKDDIDFTVFGNFEILVNGVSDTFSNKKKAIVNQETVSSQSIESSTEATVAEEGLTETAKENRELVGHFGNNISIGRKLKNELKKANFIKKVFMIPFDYVEAAMEKSKEEIENLRKNHTRPGVVSCLDEDEIKNATILSVRDAIDEVYEHEGLEKLANPLDYYDQFENPKDNLPAGYIEARNMNDDEYVIRKVYEQYKAAKEEQMQTPEVES